MQYSGVNGARKHEPRLDTGFILFGDRRTADRKDAKIPGFFSRG